MSDTSTPVQHTADGKRHHHRSALLPLTLTALGVVYGDIGTSPLYAIRECFFGSHAVPPTHDNVLGVLSLIIYALVIVISIKYIAIVMRADNQGEGGILALTALVPSRNGGGNGTSRLAVGRPVLIALGIFGTALLYGDGMITPAISVLSAVEGLEVVTPFFSPYVVPITVTILVVLFVIQQFGTHRVGRLFGPIVIVWFLTIAVLGIVWIVRAPAVLAAFNPRHAVDFFLQNGLPGFAVLGAVFLVVTGGEAMYADMGHFGKHPIRLAWFALVLPALVLNYLGQGALLLLDATASQPFFLLAPQWALVPLVGLATAAAIIASQALISASFSVTRQAIQLGLAPRLDIEHTSPSEMGQIYIPQVNWALMVATVLIVIGFGSSGAIAAAYGIAVTLAMVIDELLLFVVMTERWRWAMPIAVGVTGTFLTIDVAFFGANILKVIQGGWVTLVGAGIIFTFMTTWKTGRRLLAERLTARALPLEDFVATGRGESACPSTRNGYFHDGAAARHTSRPGAQSALQQSPSRARHSPHDHHRTGAARASRRAHHVRDARLWPVQRPRAVRVHGRSRRASSVVSGAREGRGDEPRRSDLFPRTGDDHRVTSPGDGYMAGKTVRVDGA